MDSLGLLDMLLEHGDKSGRCRGSFPIRHIDGLDCIGYDDDVMAVFFRELACRVSQNRIDPAGYSFSGQKSGHFNQVPWHFAPDALFQQGVQLFGGNSSRSCY